MTIHIISKEETQEILSKLQEQFGIKEIPGLLLRIGQERIFIYQGSLNEKEIRNLEMAVPVERIGVYFAKIQNDELRLSIEGTHILKKQITRNIFEIDNKQLETWMHGSELEVETGKKAFLVMKHNEDLLGTGKASEKKITNFIPKSRRLRERS